MPGGKVEVESEVGADGAGTDGVGAAVGAGAEYG
jgi:hypothetical protein